MDRHRMIYIQANFEEATIFDNYYHSRDRSRPQNHYEYLSQQHFQIPQLQLLECEHVERKSKYLQKKKIFSGRLAYPMTAMGLLRIRGKNRNFFQTAVAIQQNLILSTCSQDFNLDYDSVVFFPAFNQNKCTHQGYRAKAVAFSESREYSLIELESSPHQLSSIYGALSVLYDWQVQERREGERPLRNDCSRRSRSRQNERGYVNPIQQKIKLVKYVCIEGIFHLITFGEFPQINFMDKIKKITQDNGIFLKTDQNNGLVVGFIKGGKFVSIESQEINEMRRKMPFERTKVLNCSKMDLTKQQCHWIAQRNWQNLNILLLQSNRIDESICRALSASNWQHVRQLNLSLNPITPKGAFWLSKATIPNLQILELRNCLLGNEGCEWLSRGIWSRLEKLNLRTNSIGERGCMWLAGANWGQLKRLNLKKNKVGSRGCEHLAGAPWKLEGLVLNQCLIDDLGCKWLSRSKWSLEVLDLQHNLISNAGVKWLWKGRWRKLTTLLLGHNANIGREGFQHLSQLESPNLYKLNVSLCDLSQSANYPLLKGTFKYLQYLNMPIITNRNQRRGRRDDREEISFAEHLTLQLQASYRGCEVKIKQDGY